VKREVITHHGSRSTDYEPAARANLADGDREQRKMVFICNTMLSLLDKSPVVKYTYHMTHKRVGNNIKELRKNLGMTQAQLAELVGIARVSIVSIETGRYIPTIETALRISKALQVPVDQIFWLKDDVQ